MSNENPGPGPDLSLRSPALALIFLPAAGALTAFYFLQIGRAHV